MTLSLLTTPCNLIRRHRREYLIISGALCGVVLAGMLLGALFPELHAARAAAFERSQSDLLNKVIVNPLLFAATILGVNVLRTAALLIVVPSLVIPFAGMLVFAIKTIDIGIVLAPVDRTTALTLIPHAVTIMVEFQAYALVILGVYLHARAWLWPRTVAADSRRQGYVKGLSQLGRLWLPALLLFVLGAIYEVVEIYFLVPLLLAAA